MKKIYYLLTLCLLLSISACEKFLETVPTDFLAPNAYYETEAQINFARAGVYNNLGSPSLWGSIANYILGFTADEGYMNRATLPIGPWNNNQTPSDQYVRNFWNNLYNGINRANVLLDNLDNNPEIKQSFRDQVRGEMLFLRGYYYFMLVQNFGGVPLKLTATSSVVDVDQARATTREVYDQILKDMEAAEPLVPGIHAVGFGGQISKSAVRGLLARVNLHMAGFPLNDASRYPEARKWAKMVMDDAEAGHELNPSYAQIFINYAADKYDYRESIWEAEFQGNRLDEYIETTNNGWINGPLIPQAAATGRGDAYMFAIAPLFEVYETGDMRKYWNLAYFSYTDTKTIGSKTLLNEPTAAQKYAGRYSGKFRREYETLLPKSLTTTPINMPLLRYSDILLMFAEAENEINGPTAAAIEAVNKVRRRGWGIGGIKSITVTNMGSGYTSVPTVSLSGGGQAVGAAATATRDATGTNANKITAIVLNRDPTGVLLNLIGKFTSAPAVTISGGGGTGATATAVLYTEADANAPASQTNSSVNFRILMQNERMRELNFEYLRKGDLIRWGIYVPTMQNVGNSYKTASTDARVQAYTNTEQKNLLFPIPSDEINTNIAIDQNPGW